jgi:hypothetical protein
MEKNVSEWTYNIGIERRETEREREREKVSYFTPIDCENVLCSLSTKPGVKEVPPVTIIFEKRLARTSTSHAARQF